MSETVGLRSRLNRKLKVAVGKTKASKRGSEETKNRKNSKFKTDCAGPDQEFNGGKRNSRLSSKDKRLPLGSGRYVEEVDRKRWIEPETSDKKRKRVYADRRGEEGKSDNARVPNRKSLSGKGRSDTDDSFKWKRSAKGNSCVVDPSNIEKFSSARGRNAKKDGFREEKSRLKEVGHLRGYKGKLDSSCDAKRSSRRVEEREIGEDVSVDKLRSKVKIKDRWVSSELDGSRDSSLKKHPGKKPDSTKLVDQRLNNRFQAGSLGNSTKKKLRNKKDLRDDSEGTVAPPKKKKRVMRLDPYDISNKRLDDGISIDGETIEKKVDLEKSIEVSKNAQFRAIQPSPSILSFVEDNLLGRRRLIELRRAGYNTDISAPLDNIAFSTSLERERIEESVFRNMLTFFAAAKVSSSFPPVDLPEIAFAGRSNVGKSSLLNGLTRQWGVVRTSDKPGLTQTINFFKLGSKLCLVDLPGYGFAYAKEEVKDAWEELVKEYVSTRVGLKRVCLLIDTKWGMKPRDFELINLMERSQTKYQIVLTKTDTVFPMDVARRAMQIEESLKANKSVVQPLMMVSSKSGAGIRSLRSVLAKITRFTKL